jgi:hypothetical protein
MEVPSGSVATLLDRDRFRSAARRVMVTPAG